MHLCQVGVAGRRLEGVEERRHDTSEYEDRPERRVCLVRKQAGDRYDKHTNARSSKSNDSHRSSTNFVDQKGVQNHSNEADNSNDERNKKRVTIPLIISKVVFTFMYKRMLTGDLKEVSRIRRKYSKPDELL